MRAIFCRVLAVSLGCFLLAASRAEAREWTDSTGTNKSEAQFVELVDDAVRLKKPDGVVVMVRLSRLSEADQIFAFEESLRRHDEIRTPTAAGEQAARDLVAAMQALAAKHDDDTELEFHEWTDLLQEMRPALLEKLEAINTKGGSRRAAVPAIVALLQDKNIAVRVIGISCFDELGPSAAAAGPALVALLSDPSDRMRQLAAHRLAELSQETDTHFPALVALVAGDDELAAERAIGALSDGWLPGPRAIKALAQLASLLHEMDRAPASRQRIARALTRLLYPDQHGALERARIFDGRDIYSRLGRSGVQVDELRKRLQAEREKAIAATCAALRPLTADGDSDVQRAAVLILAVHAPEHLGDLSGDVLVKLMTERAGEGAGTDDADEYREYQQHRLMNAVAGLAESRKIPLRFTPPQLAALIRVSDLGNDFLVQYQLKAMGADVKLLLPELAKLVSDRSVETRWKAIELLGSDYFASDDDLTNLPGVAVSVEADAEGAIKTLRLAGKPVESLGKLTAGLAATKAGPAVREEMSAEEILKRALRDKEISDQAISALSLLETPAAIAVLREAAKNSLDADVREGARRAFEVATGEDFDPDEGGADPFAAPAAEPRNLTVELTLPPELRANHLAPLLAALSKGEVSGIRIRTTATDGKSPRDLQLQSADLRGKPDLDEPFCTVTLARHKDSDSLKIFFAAMNRPTPKSAPNLTALQFTLDYFVDAQYDRDSHRHQRRYLGAGSLPATATLAYDHTVRADDVVQALTAIGAAEEEGAAPRDLIQWVRLKPAEEGSSLWFVKVMSVKGNAASRER